MSPPPPGPALHLVPGGAERAPTPGPGSRERRRRLVRRRRRVAALVLALLLVGGIGLAWHQVHQSMPSWYARMWYPLDYEDAILREAARNDLDPALVAAVINTESSFVPDSRSGQGAVGLMQVLPSTAEFVATLPGRPSPAPDQIGRPAPNIAYGTRYLRYLVDRHGTVPLALAAYNGGETNVAQWLDEAARRGEEMAIPADIPFTETRGFVAKVLEARPIYARAYGDRLEP